MRCGSRKGVCTSSPSEKSALLATCSSNGFLSTKCRYITMRTPQSLRGGTMLTNSTRARSPPKPFNAVTMYLLKLSRKSEATTNKPLHAKQEQKDLSFQCQPVRSAKVKEPGALLLCCRRRIKELVVTATVFFKRRAESRYVFSAKLKFIGSGGPSNFLPYEF